MDALPINEEEIFQVAAALAAGERTAYLDAACVDLAVRARIERLLASHGAGGFMQAAATVPGPGIDEQLARLKPEEGGEHIGPYKLREQIGEGGFGAVWVADQETPVKRRVALKVIKLGMDTKEVIARFEQERQALALMDHPNIAKVLDAGATQYGRPYFVMELVRGIKITDYCDQAKLPTRERLELFIAVCRAVQHAHQKGIIHRDLKPSNILVTLHDGVPVPKVIDFGVAKATQGRLAEHTIYTQFQQMVGTPLYMSPEQAEMSGLDIDTRSDIYSLGVLLYELLTGRTPVDAATLLRLGLDEIRRIIREQEPPRPSTVLRTMLPAARTDVAEHRHIAVPKLITLLRGDLDWIVMKALEKDRTRRYETANGLAMDIQRHLASEPVLARPPSQFYRLRTLVRRNKLTFASATAVILALVLGVTISVSQARRANAALRELRASAPAFAEQARTLAARERFDEAIEKLDYASKLRPDVAEYLSEKADLLEAQLRLPEAAAAYRAALDLLPNDRRLLANATLCERLQSREGNAKTLSRESITELFASMQSEQRPATQTMPLARRLGAEKSVLLAYWLGRLKDLVVLPDKPLEQRLTMRDDGLLALDLSKSKFSDLSFIKDMPLGELNCTNCDQLADLSPLRGMALKSLVLDGTQVTSLAALDGIRSLETLSLDSTLVSDLAPIRESRLKTLYAIRSAVADLTPLRGMPLETLRVDSSKVGDLTPLRGMPLKILGLSSVSAEDFTPLNGLGLKTLILSGTKVRDLEFLSGMPLQVLFLNRCGEMRNFRVLKGIKTLEALALPEGFRGLPPWELAAISDLRDLPQLRQITANTKPSARANDLESKDSFFREWELEKKAFQPLRDKGFKPKFKVLEDGTWDVTLHSQPVTDLSSFKGAPLSRLEIAFTKISDLSPIAGAPLRILQIYNTPIADLTALKGMPLEEIWMGETQVVDLTPITGAPLKLFYADNNPQITNLDPLLECMNLERLMLPSNAQNLSALTKLPRLKYVSFKFSSSSGRPAQTVEEFWQWHASYYTRFVEMSRVVEELRAACREYKWKSNPYEAISVDLNGTLRVDLHGSSIADLSPLRGKPITSLNLNGTQVVELEALRGMPLEYLECEGGLVRSLDALKGMQLKYLQLGGCPVSDLTPLSGMPLERLYLGRNSEARGNNVSDLEPLKTLWLLKELALDGTQQPDVAPLAECRQLERIVLPEAVQNLGSLRQLPNLKGLAWGFPGSWDKLSPAAEFLRNYQEHMEAIRPVVEALNQGKSGTFDPRRIHREKDGRFKFDYGAISPECLVRLRGLPIRELHLNDMRQLRDLSPLAGMQTLEVLNLTHTIVTDLTPLRDLKLRRLELGYTPVSDLTPLRGQPLEVLTIDHCHELKDVSLLAEFPTLTSLLVSKEVGGVEALRKLPKLEFLSDEWSGSSEQPSRPAAEFWAEWEKNKKPPRQ